MATFYVMLSDLEGNTNWRYPTEIEATDKNDAFKAIAENVPADTIKQVLTVNEYNALLHKSGFKKTMQIQERANVGAENFQSSADFFNNVMTAATEMAEESANQIKELPPQQPISRQVNTQPQNIQQPLSVKYFEDNGAFYKLENNILYKKCWETIDPSTQEDKSDQYRIINTETNKIINNSKYAIQRLTWKKLTD
jgi:hypothetical protein